MRIPTVTGRAAATAAVLATTLAITGLSAGRLLASDAGPAHPSANTGGNPVANTVELVPSDLERAVDIAMREPLAARLGGSEGLRVSNLRPWLGENGSLRGVTFALQTMDPVSGTFPFIVNRYDEGDGGVPLRRFTVPLRVIGMESLDVAVDLESGRVVEFAPTDGTEIHSREDDRELEGSSRGHEDLERKESGKDSEEGRHGPGRRGRADERGRGEGSNHEED
ncbi:MAG: hypothetical protein ACE5EF_01680 [Dehalococcoidia bacterium]